jgi:hypothetical protein
MNADQIEFRKQFNALSQHRKLALEAFAIGILCFDQNEIQATQTAIETVLMARWSSLKERNMNNLILHALTAE